VVTGQGSPGGGQPRPCKLSWHAWRVCWGFGATFWAGVLMVNSGVNRSRRGFPQALHRPRPGCMPLSSPSTDTQLAIRLMVAPYGWHV
jgi:hypothetical protein